jgi:hypothetical protein
MPNSSSRFALAAALVAASSFTAACRDHDVKIDGGNVEHASFAKRDSSRSLGPGDIRVATTDSMLEVALIGDSVVAGLGAAARNKIKAATDTNAVSGTGIGASLEKMIKSTVAGALDHELEVPISEVTDVQYEDGMLVFYDKNGKRMQINNKGKNGERSHFSESDAQAFIAAFRAKTHRV